MTVIYPVPQGKLDLNSPFSCALPVVLIVVSLAEVYQSLRPLKTLLEFISQSVEQVFPPKREVY
jgi:hypothetical protein